MTKETIRSADGRLFMLEYEGVLAPENRANVLNQLDCSTCGQSYGRIAKLATCPTAAKFVGQVVNLAATPTGGTAPYTVVFKKGISTLATFTAVPESTTKTYAYTTTVIDTIGTQTFTVSTIDSCPSGARTCTDSCIVTVSYPTCPALTCTITGCPPSMTVGTVGTVTLTPTGGLAPYTYSWTDNAVAVGTAPTLDLSTLAVGTHALTGIVRDSCAPTVQTCTKSCTVIVYPACADPACGFVVT